MEANRAPNIANVTIETAGIADAVDPKCFLAITYARVGDLETVSTTNVRLDRSSIFTYFATSHANPPPKTDNKQDGSRTSTIVDDIDDDDSKMEELDAPPATRTSVASTPIVGRIVEKVLNNALGMSRPRQRPDTNGVKTRETTENKTPFPSTTTSLHPSKY